MKPTMVLMLTALLGASVACGQVMDPEQDELPSEQDEGDPGDPGGGDDSSDGSGDESDDSDDGELAPDAGVPAEPDAAPGEVDPGEADPAGDEPAAS